MLSCRTVRLDCVHLRRVDVGALVVAKHGDAPRGETPGKITKRLDRAEGLVTVECSRAVHQDYRREGASALGESERSPGEPTRVPLPTVTSLLAEHLPG